MTRLRRVAKFFPVIALAMMVLALIQFTSPTNTSSLTHAAPGSPEYCRVCHKSAVICDDCTECHMPATTNGAGVYIAHHDLGSQAIIPPAATVVESCTDTDCHDAGDARYITTIDPSHLYCRTCHYSGAGGVDPRPNDCQGCH